MTTVRAASLLLCALSTAVPQNQGGPHAAQMEPGGVGNEPLRISALGRPFSLGMFYDSRSDTLVPGLTLWDKETLERDMSVTPQPNTEFHIVASESISDKSASLGVDASLKASFLCGLVNVEGSAKYLKDDKKSTKQARVTLQYKSTTVFKSLSMAQLGTGNLQHSDVIAKGLATHVVTGILYGAQAFFVFSQDSSEEESVQDIQGNLQVMIKKIPFIEIEGSGALSLEDNEREQVRSFYCKFHGDFLLRSSPTTFEDAVKVYQTLPELLGPNGEKAVPVVVYLLPLHTLDSQASRLVRQISIRLVTEAENIVEGFTELEMRSNDVLWGSAGLFFPHISKSIKTFVALCYEFKLGFQGSMAQKLPSIRGGGEAEAALAEVLRMAAESSFNMHRLNSWMEDKVDQANTINTIIKRLKITEMVTEQALADKVHDSERTLVFVFSFLSSADPFLSELEKHLKDPQSSRSESAQPGTWYSSRNMVNLIIHKAKLFGDFAEANRGRDRKNIQFLALGFSNENQQHSSIHLYEDGMKVEENFDPPSKPKSVTVSDVTHDTVSLTYSAPSYGTNNITGYMVEFCEKGQERYNRQPQTRAGSATVSGLKPNTEYSIRVRAVTALGVGPEAYPKTFLRDSQFVKTLPCGPPEDLRVTASTTEIRLSWRRPTQVGEGVHVRSYAVEYAETQEHVQWRTQRSESEGTVISGLKPSTDYTIRVVCDCGEPGLSVHASVHTLTKDSCQFFLDRDTVNRYLRLSEDLLSVQKVEVDQSYTDHQQRFTSRPQVLSSFGARGRCCLEVHWWRGPWALGAAIVALSYRRICRGAEDTCRFGNNDHSWSLEIPGVDGGQYSVHHNNRETVLARAVGKSSGTVRVALDWRAGTLSFYDVSSQHPLLHTFNTAFTEELLLGLEIHGPAHRMTVGNQVCTEDQPNKNQD